MSIVNNLQIVDFTKGIKSEQVQHNFQALQEQLKKERSITAGSGVVQGLNYDTSAPYNEVREGFPFTVTDGILVDTQGNEIEFLTDTVYILSPTPVNSDLPLSSKTVNSDGTVLIKDYVPYSSTGLKIAANDLEHNGLNLIDSSGNPINPIVGSSDNPGIITNEDMSETIVKLDAEKYGGRLIGGTYTTVQPHDELIYIGMDHKLHTVPSIDSSSPSIMDDLPEDCIYLLCAVNVELPSTITSSARIVVKKDFKKIRNLYTNNDNELYICGTKFDDLQIVYMQQPENPDKDTLWYDVTTNKLLVWATENGLSEWKAVNDFSTHPVLEYKIWDPNYDEFSYPGDLRVLPEDLQTFTFDQEKEKNMLFLPGQNELQVIIDNSILMSDEFEEITLPLQGIDTSEFENYGVGFKLKNKLNRPGYVEARVTHRVYENPLAPRFQRTATFVIEKTTKYVADPNLGVPEYFETSVPYKYGENQIEVFVEGKKLLPRVPDTEDNEDYEFLEDSDLINEPKIKGVQLKKFKIPRDKFELLNGQRITYRITTSVYSYDDVFKLVEELQASNEEAIAKSNQALNKVNVLEQEIDSKLSDAYVKIDSAQAEIESHILSQNDFYDKANGHLRFDSMPSEITTWLPNGIINKTYTKYSDVLQLEDITPQDFLIIFDIGANRPLIRDTDYSIETIEGQTFLNLSPNAVLDNHVLYLTGIKFSS